MKNIFSQQPKKGLFFWWGYGIIQSFPKGEGKKTKGIYKLWKLVVEFPICGSATSATATAFAPYAVTM